MGALGHLAFLAACLPICSIFGTPAAATCFKGPVPWRFGQSISSVWRTTDGSACTSRSNHPENIAQISIVARPAHGIAGRAGVDGVAYKPNSNFNGTDRFTYAVTSNSHCRCGPGRVATIYVEVIVQ
jgi:hypothetical protein